MCVCVCVFVRNTAVLKEVPSSRAQTHTCTYAAVPLKSQCAVYSMCLLPFSLLREPFFSLDLTPPPPPLQSFCLSCFSPLFLSFSTRLVCKCQHSPICLPEPRAPSCTLCLPLSPQRCPSGTASSSFGLYKTSLLSILYIFHSLFSPPVSHPNSLFPHLRYIPFLHIPPLPSHFHFLHHSCFIHPLTQSISLPLLSFMDHGTSLE